MARKRKGDKIDGWINLDKPIGLTSTQAMAKVRWLLKAQKAGHAGTLDPLATGILPIALGEATKTISFIQDGLKTYSFTVRWGEQRDTDDMEGKVIATSDNRPSEDQIRALLPKYTGDILQTPPKFSAIKIDGERAYDLARDGEEAVRLAQCEHPAVILMDLKMPVMTGVEALRILRNDEAFTETPIVAFTAHALDAERADAIRAGFDEVISKPCLPEDLMAAVERLLTTVRQT